MDWTEGAEARRRSAERNEKKLLFYQRDEQSKAQLRRLVGDCFQASGEAAIHIFVNAETKVLAFSAAHNYLGVVRCVCPHMPSLGVSSLDLKAAFGRPPFLGSSHRCITRVARASASRGLKSPTLSLSDGLAAPARQEIRQVGLLLSTEIFTTHL
jgi:hypothetical protein